MVDHSKRETLKNVARASAAIAIGSVSNHAAANIALQPDNKPIDKNELQILENDLVDNNLAEIEVATKLSSTKNDLEIVITNKSNTTANITNMTPSEIDTARGKFDFNALFSEGAVRLDAGQSVTVPLQHHRMAVSNNSNLRYFPLSKSLKQNVSIITDNDSLAAVSFVNRTGYLA